MADRVVVMQLDVDASGAVEGLNKADQELINLTEQIAEVEDGLRNLNKTVAKDEAAKAFQKLNKIVDENILSIQELGAAADNYKNIALAAGKESPIGQEALKKAADMEKQMDSLNREVTQLAEGGRALNTTMQIGTGVIAGYTAFQSVTALLGDENEELQKTFVKLQAAQAALMAAQELKIALDKQGIIMTTASAAATNVAAFAQNAYALAVGTSTGAMKLFRIALISTGIGAIVVALGFLIANFDKLSGWVDTAIEKFKDLGAGMKIAFWPITLLIKAYELLFGTVNKELDSQEKKQQQAQAAEQKRHQARLDQIENEKNARIESADNIIGALKKQIEINDNIGKSSDDLAVKVLEAEAEKVRAIRDANQQIIQSSIEHYKNLARLRGESDEQFIESMKKQGVDLEDAQRRANEVIEENEINVQLAESRITKFKRDQNRERATNAQEARDKELEEQKKLVDSQLALEAKLTELLLINMQDGAEKELAVLMDKQGRERDALIAQHGENSELLEQLDIKQEKELEALQYKFTKERLAKEEEYVQQLIDLRLGNLSEGKDKELALLREKHRQELDEIRSKYGEQTELEKELLLRQKNELAEVEAEFDEQARTEKLEKAQQTLDIINGYLDQAGQINEALDEISERRIERVQKQRDENLSNLDVAKQKELDKENLTEKQKLDIEKKFAMQEYQVKVAAAKAEDEIAKKKFNRDKVLKIAEIGMNTASGIMQALGSAPPPISFVNAGIIGAIGIAQAAIVATKKFEGSSDSIQPPNFSSSGSGLDSSSGTTGGAIVGGGQDDTTTETDPLINGQTQPTIVISQVEINKTQQEMAQIDEVATL